MRVVCSFWISILLATYFSKCLLWSCLGHVPNIRWVVRCFSWRHPAISCQIFMLLTQLAHCPPNICALIPTPPSTVLSVIGYYMLIVKLFEPCVVSRDQTAMHDCLVHQIYIKLIRVLWTFIYTADILHSTYILMWHHCPVQHHHTWDWFSIPFKKTNLFSTLPLSLSQVLKVCSARWGRVIRRWLIFTPSLDTSTPLSWVKTWLSWELACKWDQSPGVS